MDEYQIFSLDTLLKRITIAKRIIQNFKNKHHQQRNNCTSKIYTTVGSRVRLMNNLQSIPNTHNISQREPLSKT